MNFIDNSLKFIKAQQPSIAISCFRQEDMICFSVDDNGTGIPEQELHKIFDPFYTSDKGRTVAGLGLSICREIVESNGGKIWATNNTQEETFISSHDEVMPWLLKYAKFIIA